MLKWRNRIRYIGATLHKGLAIIITCPATPQVIAAEKSEAEAALAEALPALEEARIALSDLDKSDVTEIRLGA